MLDLVVDVITCDVMMLEEVELPPQVNASSPVLPSLPRELCLPVACLLHRYLLCLLLSQNNTTIVFERLCKVLDGVRNGTEINAGQRAIFIFLNCLYPSCPYLQCFLLSPGSCACLWRACCTESHILLPPFVRHFLQAKCRDLDFSYIVSLVKVTVVVLYCSVLVQYCYCAGTVLELVVQYCYCTGTVLKLYWNWWCNTVTVLVLYWNWWCNTVTVLVLYWNWWCNTVTVLVLYWNWWCNTVTVLVLYWNWWCNTVTVLVLYWNCWTCQSASRGVAISSVKMGMQVLVQSSSDGMEGVLERAKMVLESLATQSWVREKCMQHKVHIMDKDKLGDTSDTPAQAQYLLNLLSPYRASKASFPAGITSLPYGTDSSAVVEDILKVQVWSWDRDNGGILRSLRKREGPPELPVWLSVHCSRAQQLHQKWHPVQGAGLVGTDGDQHGAIELFTNAVDMLSTLLATLPCDFYICFSSGGEDGKKTYTSCVKRLKSELSSIKSVYGNEIRQLFPLTPKPCSDYCEDCHCAAKRQPSVGEGQGPLMLSWFGAVRMKRRMLKYEEQWKMVRLHTHQKDKPYKSHFVSLPEINPMSSADSTQEAEAAPQPQEDETKMETDAGKQAPAVSGAQDVGAASKMKQVTSVLGGITPLPPSMPNSATAVMPRLPTRPVMMRGGLPGPYSTGMAPNRAQLVRTLQNVRAMNQPQQQNQIFIQQPGLTVQRSQIFPPSEMDLYRQQQQQQLLRQQRMLQMRQQQQQQQQQQQYQFRSQMRMVAPQSATPVQLQQQLMGQQGGFPAALGQGQQQQPPPPHQQGMMMRQQPAGQFTGLQQTAPGFMPGRMF
eukprot:Em0021g604a